MRAPPAPDRRRLLALAAASATAAALPRWAWSQPRLPDMPFGAGVASGSPGPASVVLWTRLVGPYLPQQAITVRWELAEDEGFTRIVQSGQAQALPELAHAVHVEVQGLAPQRWYHYRFMAHQWESPAGRTRTLPAPDAALPQLRLAYASCQRWEHGFYAAYRHMRADAPDFVVFLGDYIYEQRGTARGVRPGDGQSVETLAQYRARHALYKSDPDLQAMHQACPWLFTWDDHEVLNDHAGSLALEDAAFAARRAAAYQAYYENMPLRASALVRGLRSLAAGGELRVHDEVRFGRLARLCLLDTRQYRSRHACAPAGRTSATFAPETCPELEDPARSLLGAAQERWLDERLAAGDATTWNVLGQSTLFGPRDLQPGPGRLTWNDGWDGYPQARRRVLESLRRHRVANPVILGGDVHENWVGHVRADGRPDGAVLGVEFTTTSISSRAAAADRVPERLAENPHFVFADGSKRGYGLAVLRPDRLEVSLRVVDDATRRDAGIATQARFVVEAGRPVLQAG